MSATGYKTNAAWRTMLGAKYEPEFWGDKGKAWQWLNERKAALRARIAANEPHASAYGLDGELARQWLREDRQELARVREALFARE